MAVAGWWWWGIRKGFTGIDAARTSLVFSSPIYTLSITRNMVCDFSCSKEGGGTIRRSHILTEYPVRLRSLADTTDSCATHTSEMRASTMYAYAAPQLAECEEWALGTHVHQPPQSLAYPTVLAPV